MKPPPASTNPNFAPEEIVSGLQILLQDQFDLRGPLRAEHTIVNVISRIRNLDVVSDITTAVRRAIAATFDVSLDSVPWGELSAASPVPELTSLEGGNITMGQLAEWIAAHTPLPRLIARVGASPDEASVFAIHGLRCLAQTVWPNHQPITRDLLIASRFGRTELGQFWNRVRCLSSGRVPKLRTKSSSFRGAGAVFLFLLALPLSCLLTSFTAHMAARIDPELFNLQSDTFGLLLMVTFFVSSLVALLKSVQVLARRFAGPAKVLPRDIVTFGDCAMYITGERRGPCIECGYNLTGVVSPVCPECGERWDLEGAA